MPPEPTPLHPGRSKDDDLLNTPAATAVLEDAAAAVAGLDALDTPTTTTTPWWRRALSTGLPPLVALILFLVALAIGTPLGLLVGRVRVVRRGIGPILSGLQSLPSVAWVPAAVLWFGLTDATIYFVVLAGSIPSIANGLVAGIDQIPPILPRVGQVLGARGFASARHILLPAALPGYLAGCKQGWAFSWRSLMAAEIIAAGPLLGFGLGAYLKQGSDFNDMPSVIAAIFLILIVGIGIVLLVFRPVERRVLHARGLALAT